MHHCTTGYRYDLILFDLDGTLTDPSEGITGSMRYALAKMNLPPRSQDELLSFIGPPLLDTFRVTLGLDEADTARAVKYYRDYYTRRGIHENTIYPGIGTLLEDLRQAGFTLAVATTKAVVFAEQVLQHFSLRHHFAQVAGSNLDGTGGKKEALIASILAEHPVIPRRRAVMIGDRYFDIHGARANGIASIAVTYGYGTRRELKEVGPTSLVGSVSALRTLLFKTSVRR